MSYEHRHDLFEEARATRLQGIERDLIRDNLMPVGGIPTVSYFGSVEEQNRFLESISHTEFGRQLQNWQSRYNAQGISLILPKFSNINNISLNEQLFLAMQSIGLEKYMDGSYRVDGGMKQSILFKNLANSRGKIGPYYQFVEPSEYYISIGAVPEHLLKEIKTHGAVSGTGFQRGAGFVGDKPEVTTDHPPDWVEKGFDKPDYRDTQPEPEVTTDHIQPPSEEQDFLPPTSTAGKFNPPDWDRPYDYGTLAHQEAEPHLFPPVEEEPQVTTSQVEPPGVEEPCPDWVRDHPELSCPTEVTTDRVDPPPLVEEIIDVYPQEVTAQMSWFGNTWFPWHLELEDRRRR